MATKPPIVVDLTWTGELIFSATSGDTSMTVDSAARAGPSPVQALAVALAGCMAVDVAHILAKGRHPLRALRAHLVGDRAQDDPHRFVRMTLRFEIGGGVPSEAVERAIALSRDKYCSVWHSLRQDIDFQVSFALGA